MDEMYVRLITNSEFAEIFSNSLFLCENRISQFAISTAHPLSSNDPNDAAFRVGNKSQKLLKEQLVSA